MYRTKSFTGLGGLEVLPSNWRWSLVQSLLRCVGVLDGTIPVRRWDSRPRKRSLFSPPSTLGKKTAQLLLLALFVFHICPSPEVSKVVSFIKVLHLRVAGKAWRVCWWEKRRRKEMTVGGGGGSGLARCTVLFTQRSEGGALKCL